MDAYEHAALTYECSEKLLNYMLARELAEGKGVSEANFCFTILTFTVQEHSALSHTLSNITISHYPYKIKCIESLKAQNLLNDTIEF